MKSGPPEDPSEAELVAEALNEQGYLLQLRLLALIEAPAADGSHPLWRVSAVEYAVSTPDGQQTRIDLVLANVKLPGAHLAIEAKRAHPLYKRWVFFGGAVRPSGKYFFDIARNFSKRPGEDMRCERIVEARPCIDEVYTFYLESVQSRSKQGKRSSATEAIEDAFRQATAAQVGLMAKLVQFGQHMTSVPPVPTLVIPVVVTTAQLWVAAFSEGDIPLEHAMIEPGKLKLQAKDFVAVNYRLNDEISNSVRLSTCEPTNIQTDLTMQQMRTVFVVHSTHLREFLGWAHDKLVDP